MHMNASFIYLKFSLQNVNILLFMENQIKKNMYLFY